MTGTNEQRDDFNRRESILDFQDTLKLNETLREAVKAKQKDVVIAILQEEGFVLTEANCDLLFRKAVSLKDHEMALVLASHPSFQLIAGDRDHEKVGHFLLPKLIEREWNDVLEAIIKPLSQDSVETISYYLSRYSKDNKISRSTNWQSLRTIANPYLLNNRLFYDTYEWGFWGPKDIGEHTFLSHAIEQQAWDQLDFYLSIKGVNPLEHSACAYKLLKKSAKDCERAKKSLEKMEQVIHQTTPSYFKGRKKPRALKL